MVQINGKYLLESNTNFLEHLVGHGVPEDKAKIVDDLRPEIEVIIEGNDVTINTNSPIANAPSKWILNKEVDDPLPGGNNLKSTATLDGDTLTISSRTEDGQTGSRVFKFSDKGVVLTLTSHKPGVPVATRTYVRI